MWRGCTIMTEPLLHDFAPRDLAECACHRCGMNVAWPESDSVKIAALQRRSRLNLICPPFRATHDSINIV
jgi:hypothetical protein